jgi:hopene-associated glycosyltransferase HpnB
VTELWWWLTAPAALIWLFIFATPWRAWSTRESLDADTAPDAAGDEDLAKVTVLIPARNEAAVIGRTVAALRQQGAGLRVVLVDDQSHDGTADIARAAAGAMDLQVVSGTALPAGWAGKLWALEQGRGHVATPLTLLLDADIELAPGTLTALLRFKRRHGLKLASLMAHLNMRNVWERLLLPAFVYFFKLLYPFSLANRDPAKPLSKLFAAAAGGVILVDTAVLNEIGAFGSLRGALIDDCTLARRVKQAGHRTWLGLTHSALSLRADHRYADLHQMVARSAFTQLNYSTLLLIAVTVVLAVAFWLPPVALIVGPWPAKLIAAATLAVALGSYVPLLRYYGLHPAWSLTMPAVATLYLGMTWSSAIRYWRGVRSLWKGRSYQSQSEPPQG